MNVRIASRKSALAMAQARWVADQMRSLDPKIEVEIVPVVTQGDRIVDRPLSTVGGKGLFVTEVEAALVERRADIAVHSLKDVPADLTEGLELVCMPRRADARDVLIAKDGAELDALEAGSRVGTSSLRRTSQLRAQRPDLAYASLRGNVDTRLRKLEEGQYTAIVLAKAGLERLGIERPHWIIPKEIATPAAGQGALGIEARADDQAIRELLAPLEHPETRTEVEAERAVIRRLEGSCKIPIAAHAVLADSGARLTLRAMVGSLDGTRILSGAADAYITANDDAGRLRAATDLGREVAESLVAKGAEQLIREAIAAVERAQKQGNGSGGRFGRWG